ncbi:MAG TPA: hypothetical protein VMW77_05880 [Methanoregula sp.]|nr:hypothetical protein [Methanoregula sp.]
MVCSHKNTRIISPKPALWLDSCADAGWIARIFVTEVITFAINGLNLSYRKVSDEEIKRLMAAKKKPEAEKLRDSFF